MYLISSGLVLRNDFLITNLSYISYIQRLLLFFSKQQGAKLIRLPDNFHTPGGCMTFGQSGFPFTADPRGETYSNGIICHSISNYIIISYETNSHDKLLKNISNNMS